MKSRSVLTLAALMACGLPAQNLDLILTAADRAAMSDAALAHFEEARRALDHVDTPTALRELSQAARLAPHAVGLHRQLAQLTANRLNSLPTEEALGHCRAVTAALDQVLANEDTPPARRAEALAARDFVARLTEAVRARGEAIRDARRDIIGVYPVNDLRALLSPREPLRRESRLGRQQSKPEEEGVVRDPRRGPASREGVHRVRRGATRDGVRRGDSSPPYSREDVRHNTFRR